MRTFAPSIQKAGWPLGTGSILHRRRTGGSSPAITFPHAASGGSVVSPGKPSLARRARNLQREGIGERIFLKPVEAAGSAAVARIHVDLQEQQVASVLWARSFATHFDGSQ